MKNRITLFRKEQYGLDVHNTQEEVGKVRGEKFIEDERLDRIEISQELP